LGLWVSNGQSTYYSFDGSGNNVKNPTWGAKGTAQLRKVNFYEDKIGIPTGGLQSKLPSPRNISNIIFNRILSGSRPESQKATALMTYMGQFIDHDITQTPTTSPCEQFLLPIPKGDPIFDPAGTGTANMAFCRSTPLNGTGTSATNPRAYSNDINGYLDASVIYGLDNTTQRALRTLSGGLLKTSKGPEGELLPMNRDGNGGVLVRMASNKQFGPTDVFAAGEARANVSPMLACIHTLFYREHNRRARTLPNTLNDEQKFQKAKRLTTAIYQKITMYEYVPNLTGEPLPAYKGYNDSINPQTDLYFSTVAFRIGHDQLSPILERLDVNGKTIPQGNVLVRDGFFNPTFINTTGIGPLLRGSISHAQENIDGMLIDDVRNFLFGQVPFSSTDLAARNIQRARDHGLGSYNDMRAAYGLTPCTTFACVTSDPKAIEALNRAYGENNVNNLDPYVGALLENKRGSSLVGDLMFAAIREQFLRYRDGDRFWYQNPGVLTPEELKEVDATTLKDLIARNTDTKNMPDNLFRKSNLTASQMYNPSGETKWLVGVIALSVACAILIIVVIGLCFANNNNKRVNGDNQLYNKLVDEK